MESVDVVGMRHDVVKKLSQRYWSSSYRKKVDGTIKVISIIRDVVEIEETYAKSSIVTKMV
jgi:carboxyl-terminal processing protease